MKSVVGMGLCVLLSASVYASDFQYGVKFEIERSGEVVKSFPVAVCEDKSKCEIKDAVSTSYTASVELDRRKKIEKTIESGEWFLFQKDGHYLEVEYTRKNLVALTQYCFGEEQNKELGCIKTPSVKEQGFSAKININSQERVKISQIGEASYYLTIVKL